MSKWEVQWQSGQAMYHVVLSSGVPIRATASSSQVHFLSSLEIGAGPTEFRQKQLCGECEINVRIGTM
jgi:hypothetical protein